MYLGLYLNVSVFPLRQPKLRYLGYSCYPPCVWGGNLCLFVKFLNGLFIFIKL